MGMFYVKTKDKHVCNLTLPNTIQPEVGSTLELNVASIGEPERKETFRVISVDNAAQGAAVQHNLTHVVAHSTIYVEPIETEN